MSAHTPDNRFVIALSADFEPDGYPDMTTLTFLADANGRFGAGLYELRFVRPLEDHERGGSEAMISALNNEGVSSF